jgi:hypothetical protein
MSLSSLLTNVLLNVLLLYAYTFLTVYLCSLVPLQLLLFASTNCFSFEYNSLHQPKHQFKLKCRVVVVEEGQFLKHQSLRAAAAAAAPVALSLSDSAEVR